MDAVLNSVALLFIPSLDDEIVAFVCSNPHATVCRAIAKAAVRSHRQNSAVVMEERLPAVQRLLARALLCTPVRPHAPPCAGGAGGPVARCPAPPRPVARNAHRLSAGDGGAGES